MAKASDFEGKKPEELFYFVDYSPEEAERIGYSNYSYWGSVIQNFLKHKAAVVCLILFLNGIQLLFLSILGGYVSKNYMESKGRPVYIIKEQG